MVRPIAKIARNTRLNLTISFIGFPSRLSLPDLVRFPRLLPILLRRSLLFLLVLLGEKDRVPLGMRREILDQLASELRVPRALVEPLDHGPACRGRGLEPALDFRVRRVVLAAGLDVSVAHAREERRKIVPEIARHGLDEIGRGARRDGQRLALAPDDEFAALDIAAGARRPALRQFDESRCA